MNFFICNRYDTKKEDIHIITSKLPDDKNKICYYKYDNNKKLNLVKTIYLKKPENEKNNAYKEVEDSDELQVIEYPYQLNQTNSYLSSNNSNKIKTNNSILDNNSRYFDCFNSKNDNQDFYENKIWNEIKTMKNSFSCSPNPNLENSINDKFYSKNSELNIEDTIKGEDNINISKLKMRNKKIQRYMPNIKNIQNHIYNKNRNKSPYVSTLIKYSGFNTNKITTKDDINKKVIITEINKNNIKRKQLSKSPRNKNKVINNKTNYSNQNSKNKIKTNITKRDAKRNNDCKSDCFCDSLSSYLNSSKSSKVRNLICKNINNKNNILINEYKQKEAYNNNNEKNDNKQIIETIKKKIRKDMINYKFKKNEKSEGKRKK